ncbi:hypothetical protein AB0K60_18090 [Thermopolyspora sp. NPDC052614]|uniref:hypothetical protein n=1 Tax=Thermopolyspora sp. NPDC052614 TaxID=3155682 RepID=UPI00343359E2
MSVVRVSVQTPGRPVRDTDPAAAPADLTGGWRASTWLGAPAPGGLALPAAHPTMSWLYSPRGVFLDDRHLVVADSGNHRVLIWHGVPDRDEQAADVVLGQPDGESEGPAAGGRGPEHGVHLPTGVLIHDGRLVVADAWHHRILVWDQVPSRPGQPPDLVLGQRDLTETRPNRGGECSAATMYWPYGVGVVDGRFYVADTGNRRVLGWADGIPESPDRPADLVLGQPGPGQREENRGDGVGPSSFRWPHDITGTADTLLVADAGDHRLLGWRPHPGEDRPADLVLGQPDFHSATEFPYAPQRADRLRFPYAASVGQAPAAGTGDAPTPTAAPDAPPSAASGAAARDADAGPGAEAAARAHRDGSPAPVRLAVADTANNRVLLWENPSVNGGPADAVLGQPSFTANGENRWAMVERDSLCWPYGLCLHGDTLAVADSGNNRVVLWRRG